ncbi:AAA family ATPase [Vibrio sp. McD22-P3]|uniref:AAA family ATPase n=1 Tax=Vibrio sp. McD22-P3 TaxID=2724880 RepID=UPI001F261B11|nr:MoxR family ATPase [Vibrio sp. McD22-P3]MCF4175706.1 MoxR family ATPase [Vibrio sp. McD22-P3]
MDTKSTASELQSLSHSLGKQIIGQQHVVESMLIGLIANGHILLEGLPGTAKTRSVRSLAKSLSVDLNRIQFTPDLMPSDVVGYETLSSNNQMTFNSGPVFTNILLADEINRAPPKVQSALLEAMEERQVTINGTSHPLPDIFLVLATQNPVEQEGTYPLPEAQLDRFLMKVVVDYPTPENELKILQLVKGEENQTTAPSKVSPELIYSARHQLTSIRTSESIEHYIVDLINATRDLALFPDSSLSKWIDIGISPRGSIALDKAARVKALLEGRDYVEPDDVLSVIDSVLGHRLILTYDAIADGITSKEVIKELTQWVSLR